jgi:hypothetical protein
MIKLAIMHMGRASIRTRDSMSPLHVANETIADSETFLRASRFHEFFKLV